MLELCIQL